MPAAKPSRAADSVAVESRVATIKQRPSSRCFPSVSDVNVSGGSSGENGWASGSTRGAILTASGHVPALARPGAQPQASQQEAAPPPVSGHAVLWAQSTGQRSGLSWTWGWPRSHGTGAVCPGFPGTARPAAGMRLAWRISPCCLWFAVRVRTPGHRRDDAHRAREPEGPVPGPPSRYDAKAEVNR